MNPSSTSKQEHRLTPQLGNSRIIKVIQLRIKQHRHPNYNFDRLRQTHYCLWNQKNFTSANTSWKSRRPFLHRINVYLNRSLLLTCGSS